MNKKNSGKAPAYMMYPKDWNSDIRLKQCSYSAQGLWIRLVNESYDMPEKGVFKIDKNPLKSDEILQNLCGKMIEKRKAFNELLKWNVIKQMDDGTFYCQRLRADMRLREIRRECGRLGGNPNLLNQKLNQPLNQKQTPSVSSSVSSSISSNKEYIHTRQEVADTAILIGLPEEQAEIFYEHYTAQGWLLGNGLPIVNLASALCKWRRNQFKFETEKPKEFNQELYEAQFDDKNRS